MSAPTTKAMTETQKAQTIGQAAYEARCDISPSESGDPYADLPAFIRAEWERVSLAVVKHALAQLAPRYKLVPREPTGEMETVGLPYGHLSYWSWRKMYDAAPEVNIEEALKVQK